MKEINLREYYPFYNMDVYLEEGELVVARLGGVGAELRAVAALVAHLVDVDDLMAAIGQLDHDVRAVRAGIDAVFTHGGAL